MARQSLRCFLRNVHNGLAQLWNTNVRATSASGSKPHRAALINEGSPCQRLGERP
jgi:hypothetical protein